MAISAWPIGAGPSTSAGITKEHLYCLRHLPTHLAEVSRDGDLRTLLLSFNWLQTKLEATDVNSLIADYDFLTDDADLRTVQQSVLRQSAHILAHNPRELPCQLIGRLPRKMSQDLDGLLKGASEPKGFPWLRPLSPTLASSYTRQLPYSHATRAYRPG